MKALKALIRHNVLRGNASELKELFLTPSQMKLLKLIASRDVTSKCLSDEQGITMGHAYDKLEQLRRGGYLTRENIGKPNGGAMYQYGVTKIVNNLLNS
jgi:predicted transcriptional regulator